MLVAIVVLVVYVTVASFIYALTACEQRRLPEPLIPIFPMHTKPRGEMSWLPTDVVEIIARRLDAKSFHALSLSCKMFAKALGQEAVVARAMDRYARPLPSFFDSMRFVGSKPRAAERAWVLARVFRGHDNVVCTVLPGKRCRGGHECTFACWRLHGPFRMTLMHNTEIATVSGLFANGKLHGFYEHKCGSLVLYQGWFDRGKRKGLHFRYIHERRHITAGHDKGVERHVFDGITVTCHRRADGLLDGPVEKRGPRNVLLCQFRYEAGKPAGMAWIAPKRPGDQVTFCWDTGVYERRIASGQLVVQSHWKGGVPHGDELEWDAQGRCVRCVQWRNGRRVWKRDWRGSTSSPHPKMDKMALRRLPWIHLVTPEALAPIQVPIEWWK